MIILVRPQLAENIGAAARAMANFGLMELRLVAPRDGWPQTRAFEVASSGESILHQAKVFATTEDALADIHVAYATTARARDMVKRCAAPDQCCGEIVALAKSSRDSQDLCAILFGPERTGLENDDLALCDALVTIPTTEHFSLNIGQAVVVMGYEWFRTAHGARQTTPCVVAHPSSIPASKGELSGLFSHLETALEECNYFREDNKREGLWHSIRALFVRMQPSSQEVHTLRGIIRALREPRGPVSRK